MTQPIQEPTTQRSISQGKWGENQLFRRPAPASGDVFEYAGLSGISPVTVPTATWTTLTGWSNVLNFGNNNYIFADTAGTNHIEITQQLASGLVSFGAGIEWSNTFTATRRLRVGPSGFFFPTGAGLQELFLGEEGSINDASMLWQINGSVGVTTSITFEVWQDSGIDRTVTGSTGVHFALIGLVS